MKAEPIAGPWGPERSEKRRDDGICMVSSLEDRTLGFPKAGGGVPVGTILFHYYCIPHVQHSDKHLVDA